MKDREWREQLKAGDKVPISKPFGHPPVTGEVVRTTMTRIVVKCNPWGFGKCDYNFRKDNGCAIPYSRDGLRLSPPTTGA